MLGRLHMRRKVLSIFFSFEGEGGGGGQDSEYWRWSGGGQTFRWL